MKLTLLFFCCTCMQFFSFGQTLSYQELTPILSLIKSPICEVEEVANNEKDLLAKLKDLNWDFGIASTYEDLYDQTRNEKIDYRYFLVLAKAAVQNFQIGGDYSGKPDNNISYYYRSLFLNLAVQNCNKNIRLRDSIKYEYTKRYILATLMDSCFPSTEAFQAFATISIKYSKDLLNSMGLNLSKNQKSELYYIIADGLLETAESMSEEKIAEVIKYLSMALKEDPDNWRALLSRADLKKSELKNYPAAIADYVQLINLFETENKINIINHNNWLKKRGLTAEDNKSFIGIRPTYKRMIDVIDCFISLNDYKSSLIWLDKSLISIQEHRKYSRNSESAADYEGLIYYYKAYAFSELKQKNNACAEIEKAINAGYNYVECKKIQEELYCVSKPLINNSYTSVPMTKVNGVYEIPITINEVLKLNFIFDARASDVSISPDVALTLIKSGTVTNGDFIGTSTYKFADGSFAKSQVFIIRKIQIGNKVISNVKASISNSVNSPLLLGQSVLNKFGKVTIDYKTGTIKFED